MIQRNVWMQRVHLNILESLRGDLSHKICNGNVYAEDYNL